MSQVEFFIIPSVGRGSKIAQSLSPIRAFLIVNPAELSVSSVVGGTWEGNSGTAAAQPNNADEAGSPGGLISVTIT